MATEDMQIGVAVPPFQDVLETPANAAATRPSRGNDDSALKSVRDDLVNYLYKPENSR
jgi:hypothetical protein